MTEKFRSMVIHAVKSVIAQGEPSIRAGHVCAYRGENGKKCAIGHLISDAAYSAHLEGKTITDDQVRKAVSLSQEYPLSVGESAILDNLQSAHDQAYDRTRGYEGDFVQAFKDHVRSYVPAEVLAWLEPELG